MEKKRIVSAFEKSFENILWSTRFIVLIGVVAGVLGALALFVYGTYDMISTLVKHSPSYGKGATTAIISVVVGTVDVYLIGIVVLLFSFGTYELFVSKIDIAHSDDEVNILEIRDLDQLKNRILKVIVMVLVVSFFKQVLEMKFGTPLEMLYLAISILLLSASTFFLKK